MAREMLKLRKGDTAIAIKKDGNLQLAGIDDTPLINEKGMISPVILFAAAWAKKDQKLMEHLVDNFKTCVKEGYFGDDAKKDYEAMETAATSDAASGAVTFEEKKKQLEAIAEQGPDPKVESQMKKMVGSADIKETDKQIL